PRSDTGRGSAGGSLPAAAPHPAASAHGRNPHPPAKASGHAAMTGIEAWMRHRRRQVLLAIAGLSLLVRAGYYAELSRGPLIAAHRWAESDMSFFDRWAHEIVAGDWQDRKLPLA